MSLYLFPKTLNINFIGRRMIWIALASGLVILSLFKAFSGGVNLGIDFKGGFVINIRTAEKANLEDLRKTLNGLELGDITPQEVGKDGRDVLIKVEKQPGDDKAQNAALQKIKAALGPTVEYRSVDTVGPKASETLIKNGTQAVLLSLLAMLVYVAFRFEWRFGVCAIIALLHDALAVIGFYALTGLEFNMPAILAILITIGYSINDTVVIFDRVRENLYKYKEMDMSALVNLSINETLSRTVITSGTTLLSLLALYLFGGDVISTYSLPILVGVTFGTYSSIFVSGPLLSYFDIRKMIEKDEPEQEPLVVEDEIEATEEK